MRLTELDPRWFTQGLSPDCAGISFLCPCCRATRLAVAFIEAIDRDGLPQTWFWPSNIKSWHRTGNTFDTLTLAPSIDASKFKHWHGSIENGEIK